MPKGVREKRVWLFAREGLLDDRIAATAETRDLAFRKIGFGEIDELESTGGLLLIDLDMGIDTVRQAIGRARGLGEDLWYICGYGSSLDAEALRTLREIGADRVLSRSRLVSNLEHILLEVFPPKT